MSTSTRTLGVAEWHAHNADHLALALGWLRLRLALAAGEDDAPSAEAVAARREQMRAAEGSTPPPALELLREAFGLSDFERDLVLLCAGMELDTRIAELCARAHRDPRLTHPTFALALSILDDPDWSAVAPTGTLRAHRLVDAVASGPPVPLTMRPLATDERIVHFLKGLNVLDERLARIVRPFTGTQRPLPDSQRATADEIETSLTFGAAALVQLVGGRGTTRRALVAEICDRLRFVPHELDAASLPESAEEADELARLWRRESRLLPTALLVTAGDEALTAAQARALRALVARSDMPVFLGGGEACTELTDISVLHDVRAPTPAEQRAAWGDALGGGQEVAAGRLAAAFDLDLMEIERVADEAVWAGDGDIGRGAWRLGSTLHRPRLDALAQRIQPVAGWADLVLADETTRLLHVIADQVRHRSLVYDSWGWRERMSRGLGITALFSGESGTGKTMAAEVLARDLGIDLYRIDLAGVVSKYIGETEKNLRRLFDAAESGGVLLFFDEADALFGKRSEVKDSHDRYANIEVDYLLQRMESYRGLAVLATNLRSALDPAFTRRLRFIVPFALPNRSERERMWRQVFPAEVPTRDLDVQRLSRMSLSGALIHAIALNASFAAAAAGGPVTMELLADAARTELRKADRPISEVAGL